MWRRARTFSRARANARRCEYQVYARYRYADAYASGFDYYPLLDFTLHVRTHLGAHGAHELQHELLEAIEARPVILGKNDLARPRHVHCRLLQLIPATEEQPGLDSHFDERRAYVKRGAAVVSFERAPVC